MENLAPSSASASSAATSSTSLCQTGSFNDAGVLQNIFESILVANEFSDVTLCVKDKKFPAHKAILASWSQPLKTQFLEAPDKKEITLAFDHIEPQHVQCALRYIYTGKYLKTNPEIHFLVAY